LPEKFIPPSSVFVGSLTGAGRAVLGSDTSWLCRLVSGGAGGVFRGCVEDSDAGSGVLPAASLSNIDSRSDSWLALVGAAGKGLFKSVGIRID
jgi:hypothetical protein